MITRKDDDNVYLNLQGDTANIAKVGYTWRERILFHMHSFWYFWSKRYDQNVTLSRDLVGHAFTQRSLCVVMWIWLQLISIMPPIHNKWLLSRETTIPRKACLVHERCTDTDVYQQEIKVQKGIKTCWVSIVMPLLLLYRMLSMLYDIDRPPL